MNAPNWLYPVCLSPRAWQGRVLLVAFLLACIPSVNLLGVQPPNIRSEDNIQRVDEGPHANARKWDRRLSWFSRFPSSAAADMFHQTRPWLLRQLPAVHGFSVPVRSVPARPHQDDKLTFREAKQKAYNELNKLKAIGGPLTPDQTRPTWDAIFALYETGREGRKAIFELYRELEPLDLPLEEKFETYRYLGQEEGLIRRNRQEGSRYFKAAVDRYRTLTDEEKETVAWHMANILNLYSSMLPDDSAPTIEGEADNESPENEDVVDIDQLFLEDPILRKHADQATLLNAMLRASKRALAMRKFDDSIKLTGDALGLLDKQRASRLDRHWRIGA